MGYFLKKSNFKKGTYLQIYESFYDPERKGGAHRSYKALGYLDDLIALGIEDPISFYQEEVNQLNQKRKEDKQTQKAHKISEETPERFAGYFPLKGLNDSLGVKKYLDLMQMATGFKFNVYSVLSALVYSRAVMPCSKSKTYDEVLPRLVGDYDFSLSQLYSALEYVGSEYEKVIEIYNHQVHLLYPFNTSHTYFDCTNFYFEIDKEDDFRRKGPSKENRKEPIVGLGLLLDANQIPIGMKLYPGNESEKPVLRNVIDSLKKRNNITGRTIQVADKGLNCADNILHALKEGDGYIFSKSVKSLPEIEITWLLMDHGWKDVKNSQDEVVYRIKDCIDDFEYTFYDENGKGRRAKLTEKRVATYNAELAQKQLFEINKEVEKAKELCLSRAKRSEFGDASRFVTFDVSGKTETEADAKIAVNINEAAVEKAKKLAGYNLLVTSEISMTNSQIYEAYHNLWRIEESFRVMKSQLDARPVYLQKKETITGHFLICYLAVLLTRLIQFKVLGNNYSSEVLFGLFKEFRVVKISDRKYVNLSRRTDFLEQFSSKSGLPLLSYFLSEGDINRIMAYSPIKRKDNP